MQSDFIFKEQTNIFSLERHRWKTDEPMLTALPPAPKACREIVFSGCTKGCVSKNCSSKKAGNMPCSAASVQMNQFLAQIENDYRTEPGATIWISVAFGSKLHHADIQVLDPQVDANMISDRNDLPKYARE